MTNAAIRTSTQIVLASAGANQMYSMCHAITLILLIKSG